ncbi:hypothetical protein RMCBS344292_14999 [Rhizopus microsporus]|nr:hypothetical protein RMCBS344292_14999 [Rhizopus microsporus]
MLPNTGCEVKSEILETSGYWSEGRKKETSANVSELKTIYFALKLYIPNNRRTRQSDSSQTAELSLEYVTETDKTESYTLQTLVLHFQETTNEYDLAAPLSSHPRARESIKTDPASHRKIPLYERKLPRRLFCQVRRTMSQGDQIYNTFIYDE